MAEFDITYNAIKAAFEKGYKEGLLIGIFCGAVAVLMMVWFFG